MMIHVTSHPVSVGDHAHRRIHVAIDVVHGRVVDVLVDRVVVDEGAGCEGRLLCERVDVVEMLLLLLLVVVQLGLQLAHVNGGRVTTREACCQRVDRVHGDVRCVQVSCPVLV